MPDDSAQKTESHTAGTSTAAVPDVRELAVRLQEICAANPDACAAGLEKADAIAIILRANAGFAGSGTDNTGD